MNPAKPSVRGRRLAAALRAMFALLLLPLAPAGRAAEADSLRPILEKTRAGIQEFIERLSAMRYEEDVLQEKLKKDGKAEYKQQTVYDSLLLVRFTDGQLGVEESRYLEKEPRRAELRPLLLTNGFSTLAIIFHPYYDESFHFARLEDQVLDGARLARVSFEYVPGKPTPVLYQILGGDRPLAVSGIAWIDPESGAIHRIEMEMGAGLTDVGLKTLRATLHYGTVLLRDDPHPHWLPASATIDLETAKQHWRNTHRFSDYRRYLVEMKFGPYTDKP